MSTHSPNKRKCAPVGEVLTKKAATTAQDEDDSKCALCQFDTDSLKTNNEDKKDAVWIECDHCYKWYHARCVGLEEFETKSIDQYNCVNCVSVAGPSTKKTVKNDHRHNYYEESDSQDIQIGTKAYIKSFEATIDDYRDGVTQGSVHVLNDGTGLKQHLEGDWNQPILIRDKAGIYMTVPDSDTFTYKNVLQMLGPERIVDVIDVYRQRSESMKLGTFVHFFEQPSDQRETLYNMLSLEFSDTKMADLVRLPADVLKLSWVHQIWPDPVEGTTVNSVNVVAEHVGQRPNAALFCLLGMAQSWTDFHIDFGGSSVWYHVMSGEKVFFVVPPTELNLSEFLAHGQSEHKTTRTFYDTMTNKHECHRLHVKRGETLLLPSGWIHMVYTPVDSFVLGGNFLNYNDTLMQFKVYRMEQTLQYDTQFQFPSFELCSLYAAKLLTDIITEYTDDKEPAPVKLLRAAQHFVAELPDLIKQWNASDDLSAEIGPLKPLSIVRQLKKAHHSHLNMNKNDLSPKRPKKNGGAAKRLTAQKGQGRGVQRKPPGKDMDHQKLKITIQHKPPVENISADTLSNTTSVIKSVVSASSESISPVRLISVPLPKMDTDEDDIKMNEPLSNLVRSAAQSSRGRTIKPTAAILEAAADEHEQQLSIKSEKGVGRAHQYQVVPQSPSPIQSQSTTNSDTHMQGQHNQSGADVHTEQTHTDTSAAESASVSVSLSAHLPAALHEKAKAFTSSLINCSSNKKPKTQGNTAKQRLAMKMKCLRK